MSYVGWDWASRTHDVTVLDDDGHRQARWAFEHTESGWTSTLQRLRCYGEPHELPVIIERTSGLVVDRLLEAGHLSCRCIRPRFTLRVLDGEPLARNLIQETATSWPTTCAPTDTDCAG